MTGSMHLRISFLNSLEKVEIIKMGMYESGKYGSLPNLNIMMIKLS